jgi:hypothetical protein
MGRVSPCAFMQCACACLFLSLAVHVRCSCARARVCVCVCVCVCVWVVALGGVRQIVYVEEHEKRSMLLDLLANEETGLTLIFVETKRGADALDEFLYAKGFKCTSIHGDRDQRSREEGTPRPRCGRTNSPYCPCLTARVCVCVCVCVCAPLSTTHSPALVPQPRDAVPGGDCRRSARPGHPQRDAGHQL